MQAFCCLLCVAALAETKEEAACWQAINKGNQHLWQFRPQEALLEYHAGMHIAKNIGSEFLYAETLFGIGQALWYNGQFSAAADTVQLSLVYYKRARAKGSIGGALRILSNIYDDQGDYENAFKTVSEALELFGKNRRDHNAILSLVQMGTLYKNIGDYESAIYYYREAEKCNPGQGQYPFRELNNRMGELYVVMDKVEAARSYYYKALIGNPKSKVARLGIGNTYLREKNYTRAFHYFDSVYRESRSTADINIIIASGLGLGKIYLRWKQLPEALRMVQGSLQHSLLRGARQSQRDAYELLSAIYEAAGDSIQAFQYYKRYEAVKDSVVSSNFRSQLFAFKQRAASAKLESQRNMLVIVVLGLVVLSFSVFFILSLRHKNEKLHLKQRASELEMQALRAQMNPHFIFNCLSSINHFILNNESDKASEYLTRFSRMIRMVMVNAGKITISLEDELEMLRLYLNMEQLRFKAAFDYYICCGQDVYPAMIQVPSFILQPFCENAIWHGLLHKEGKGRLELYFTMEGEMLVCSIRDNGIGRQKAAAFKKAGAAEKIASFGNRLSAERLSLFNGAITGAAFAMEDITDEKGEVAGTKVTLRIYNKAV